MDKASYWMWTSRRKSSMLPRLQSSTTAVSYSYKDSWEEQAFAEDSAGVLGGCIWPPRSYTCNFCRREFRSAQALGGHMNVHRRDRARLKQSPNSHLEPSEESDVQYPPQVSTLVCNPNPNSDPHPAAPSFSPSKTLTWLAEENGSEQTLVSSPYSSSPVQEYRKSFSFSTLPSVTGRGISVSDLKLDLENTKTGDVCFRDQKEYVRSNSSVPSLELVRQRSWTPEEEDILEKRRRKDAPLPLFIASDIGERRMIDMPLPFFLRPVSHERHHLRTEVLGLGANPMDDLDLELRLGDRPKVK